MRVGEVGFQSVLCKSFSNILEYDWYTFMATIATVLGFFPKVSHYLAE